MPAAPSSSSIFRPLLSLALHRDHGRQQGNGSAALSELGLTEPLPCADHPHTFTCVPLTAVLGGGRHCVPVLQEDTEAQRGEPKPFSQKSPSPDSNLVCNPNHPRSGWLGRSWRVAIITPWKGSPGERGHVGILRTGLCLPWGCFREAGFGWSQESAGVVALGLRDRGWGSLAGCGRSGARSGRAEASAHWAQCDRPSLPAAEGWEDVALVLGFQMSRAGPRVLSHPPDPLCTRRLAELPKASLPPAAPCVCLLTAGQLGLFLALSTTPPKTQWPGTTT